MCEWVAVGEKEDVVIAFLAGRGRTFFPLSSPTQIKKESAIFIRAQQVQWQLFISIPCAVWPLLLLFKIM